MAKENNIVIRAGVGDAFAMIAAEGNGYSPDLVHDMMARTHELLGQVLKEAIETGYIRTDIDDDIDDDIDEDVDEDVDEDADEDVEVPEEEVDNGRRWWI
jgi:hypothetical protein